MGAWPGVPSPTHGSSPAQGAALASMAGLMTYGRRQFEHLDATVRRLIPPFHAAAAELTALVDADARAFQAYLVGAQRDPASPREPGGDGQWTAGAPPGVKESGEDGGCSRRRGVGSRGGWREWMAGAALAPLPSHSTPGHGPALSPRAAAGWGGRERGSPGSAPLPQLPLSPAVGSAARPTDTGGRRGPQTGPHDPGRIGSRNPKRRASD